MNVEVLETDGRRIKLRVDDATTGQINALRRTMLAEVPTLAIEDVTIYDNRSALFDEIIAHRLGMLPVPTDPSLFAEWDPEAEPEEDQEGHGDVLYTLTFEGPGTVRARDLTPATEDESAEIAEPDVPIVKLGRDQRLMLEATATLGTGDQHAKWQPVSAVGYRQVPTVEITGDLGLNQEELDDLASMAPEGALDVSDSGEPEILDEVEAHDFLYNVDGHFDLDNVTYGTEDRAFFFNFEADGSMDPKTVLREAIKILDGKLTAVHEEAATLQ